MSSASDGQTIYLVYESIEYEGVGVIDCVTDRDVAHSRAIGHAHNCLSSWVSYGVHEIEPDRYDPEKVTWYKSNPDQQKRHHTPTSKRKRK